MAISPVGSSIGALPSLQPLVPKPADAAGTSGDFSNMVKSAVDNLQSTQDKASDLATQAATGQLTNVHDYMIAATQASLATELTVAVRNKAVDAFNDIMRMQA